MNFKVIENSYVDWETIEEDFTTKYLFSSIKNNDLRMEYNMTHREFQDCCNMVNQTYGLSRRPFWKHRQGSCKYFYKVKNGFIIMKRISGENVYFGFTNSLSVAKELVELCKKASWDIDVCKKICKGHQHYVI